MDKLSEILHKSIGCVVYSKYEIKEMFNLSSGKKVFIWVDNEMDDLS